MKVYHTETSIQGELPNGENVNLMINQFKDDPVIEIRHVYGKRYKFTIPQLLKLLEIEVTQETRTDDESA